MRGGLPLKDGSESIGKNFTSPEPQLVLKFTIFKVVYILGLIAYLSYIAYAQHLLLGIVVALPVNIVFFCLNVWGFFLYKCKRWIFMVIASLASIPILVVIVWILDPNRAYF